MDSVHLLPPPPYLGGGAESPLPSSPASSSGSPVKEIVETLSCSLRRTTTTTSTSTLTPKKSVRDGNELAPSVMTPERDDMDFADDFAELTSTPPPLRRAPPNSALTTPDMKTPSGVSSAEVRLRTRLRLVENGNSFHFQFLQNIVVSPSSHLLVSPLPSPPSYLLPIFPPPPSPFSPFKPSPPGSSHDHPLGYGEREGDFWSSIQKHYDDLMDDGLIEKCRDAESDFSLDEDSSDTQSAVNSRSVSFMEFLDQYKELSDWLLYMKRATVQTVHSQSEKYLNQVIWVSLEKLNRHVALWLRDLDLIYILRSFRVYSVL